MISAIEIQGPARGRENENGSGHCHANLVMIFYTACDRPQVSWWGSRFDASKSASPGSRYFVCLFARFPNAVPRPA
jgi:hypothetical protein